MEQEIQDILEEEDTLSPDDRLCHGHWGSRLGDLPPSVRTVSRCEPSHVHMVGYVYTHWLLAGPRAVAARKLCPGV